MYCLVKLCRLCLTFKGDLNNMCNDNIIEKATACIGDLEFDYNLPCLICNDCLEMLDLFFNFRNRCLQSEFYLNYYLEKLSQSKSNFKTVGLRVNVVNNIGVSPVKNSKEDKVVKLHGNRKQESQDITVIECPLQKKPTSIMKSKQTFGTEEADDIFLEEEEEELVLNTTNIPKNKCKSLLKRKSTFDVGPDKKQKTELSPTTSSSTSSNSKQHCLYTDITESVKLRKRRVQLNRTTLPPSPDFKSSIRTKMYNTKKTLYAEKTNSLKNTKKLIVPVGKLKSSSKSCIYSGGVVPAVKSDSQIATKTDLEKDIAIHCIQWSDVPLSFKEQSQQHELKTSIEQPKIQVRKLESLKCPESAIEKNELYKANFSNILQLSTVNSTFSQHSVSKGVGSYKILFNNVDPSPKVKIQYVPILQPIQSKVILSHLKMGNNSSKNKRSLLKSNQTSSNNSSITTNAIATSYEEGGNCVKTIRYEHNYSTESDISKNCSSNVEKEGSNCLTSPNTNSKETVTLKDKINETWAKYIILQKINNLKSLGPKNVTKQQSLLKTRLERGLENSPVGKLILIISDFHVFRVKFAKFVSVKTILFLLLSRVKELAPNTNYESYCMLVLFLMDSNPGTSKSNDVTDRIYSKIETGFHSDVIKESLKLRFKDTKTKITEEAVELVKEITKAMVIESAIRAAKQANMRDDLVVSLNNVETMLLQLVRINGYYLFSI
ncbi:hypothetical protein FQR65_LT00692 [Abscondita terminalis]|nr:hypothetical protein FQR65_LT00692 [Abscondita terminalis]